MSAKETTSPAQRMKIDLSTGPNPPWTNVYFDCACGARYQLGASDDCTPVGAIIGSAAFRTPPCWTCDEVNVVTLP